MTPCWRLSWRALASDNGPAFVTLRGGGMFVVDARSTPSARTTALISDEIAVAAAGPLVSLALATIGYVLALATSLRAAALFAFILAGQAVASLAVDHFGWVGFDEQPVTVLRVVGMLGLAAGVVLVRVS